MPVNIGKLVLANAYEVCFVPSNSNNELNLV